MNQRIALAILLLLGVVQTAFADGIPQIVDSTTSGPWTMTVFNDSGGTRTSGDVVVWDNDDTEFDRNGYRYVTTTTTADLIHVAGVMLTGSCVDQTLCEIVVEGWARTNVVGSLTEDTMVATSTTAARMGDYTPAANTCALGRLLENINLARGISTDVCGAGNLCQMPVFVQISCQ